MTGTAVTDLYTRRFRSEVELLHALAARNPGRILDVAAEGGTISLVLHGPSSMAAGTTLPCLIARHDLHIDFPVHFPAVPMEMFLARATVHPNIHPETGFVCLWDRHRVSNTVEHALHKLVAMLAGQLQNTEPRHVMQPEALAAPRTAASAMPLLGVQQVEAPRQADMGRRRRLQ